ncbi:MAG TPA: zinc ribbon domain-containing protein [Solirubrobacteraceae bacterium]
MRAEKTCPDCAESVAAAARVCRFCGYRFASAPLTSQLHWLRRPVDTRTLPEFLLDWGMALAQGEDVAFFGMCEMEGEIGFLLLTTLRLAFFVPRGARKLMDWSLPQLRDVEVRGRGRRASLHLSGEAGEVTLRHFAGKAVPAELVELLAAARLARPSSPG